jgi:serine/threonine-protein kinase
MLDGTPFYVAPECVVDPKSVIAASDVYGLGATLYHALAGKPPIDGENVIAIMNAHVKEPPRPLRELRADLDAAVEESIMRCLAKDPAQRPTAGVLAEAMAKRLGKPGATATRAPRSRSVIEPFS